MLWGCFVNGGLWSTSISVKSISPKTLLPRPGGSGLAIIIALKKTMGQTYFQINKVMVKETQNLSLWIETPEKACCLSRTGKSTRTNNNIKELKMFCIEAWNQIPLQLTPTLQEVALRFLFLQGKHHKISRLVITLKPVFGDKNSTV